MGFLDFLSKSGSGKKKCRQCRREVEHLPVTKKIAGKTVSFCSKECSSKYRIDLKKQARNPPPGGRMPW